MDPMSLGVICSVSAVVAVAAVWVGLAKIGSERRAARDKYLSALYYADDAKLKLEEGAAAIRAAREDLRRAEERSREHAGEIKAAGERFDTASGHLDDVSAAFDKYAALNEPAPDSTPVGREEAVPTSFTTWTEDGDRHFVQATLWPGAQVGGGGGIDLTTAINGAAQSVSLTWKEFDVLVSMAGRLRPLDDAAPEPLYMEAFDGWDEDQLPYADEAPCGRKGCPTFEADCPNCGQTESQRRAAWEEIANGPAGQPPAKQPWENPDLVED